MTVPRAGFPLPMSSNGSDEVARLRAEIARTRASIESTLGEIEHSLSTARRKVVADADDVKAAVAETMNWRRMVRRHPVAAAAGVAAIALLSARRVAAATQGGAGVAAMQAQAGNYLRHGGRKMTDGLVHELIRAGRDILVPALVARVITHIDRKRSDDVEPDPPQPTQESLPGEDPEVPSR